MTTSPTDRLIDSARNRRLHHSLLLHGPSPATLSSAAMRIAKALNCRNGKGDDDCDPCTRIDKSVHPDVRLVTTAKDRKATAVAMTDEFVDSVAILGSAEECREKIAAFVAAGVTTPIISPLAVAPGAAEEVYKALAPALQ